MTFTRAGFWHWLKPCRRVSIRARHSTGHHNKSGIACSGSADLQNRICYSVSNRLHGGAQLRTKCWTFWGSINKGSNKSDFDPFVSRAVELAAGLFLVFEALTSPSSSSSSSSSSDGRGRLNEAADFRETSVPILARPRLAAHAWRLHSYIVELVSVEARQQSKSYLKESIVQHHLLITVVIHRRKCCHWTFARATLHCIMLA
jgi:hypothetical protein